MPTLPEAEPWVRMLNKPGEIVIASTGDASHRPVTCPPTNNLSEKRTAQLFNIYKYIIKTKKIVRISDIRRSVTPRFKQAHHPRRPPPVIDQSISPFN
jgi:hypothetical protein